MTHELVAGLKAQYSGRRLLKLTSGAAEVVALSPNLAEMAKHKAMLDDKAQAGAAMESLVRACIVFPDRAGLDALLADRPLLVETWFRVLRKEAGFEEKVDVSPAFGFEAKYPGRRVVALTTPLASVKAKVPSPTEMREFRRRDHAGESGMGLADWLARTCIVEPDGAGLNVILDRQPLLIEKWFLALIGEGGADEKVSVGEL